MIENTAKNFVSNKTQIDPADVIRMLGYYQLTEDTIAISGKENLLPTGLLNRMHPAYPNHSGILAAPDFLFKDKNLYSGLNGFGEIVDILQKNEIEIGHTKERELFSRCTASWQQNMCLMP